MPGLSQRAPPAMRLSSVHQKFRCFPGFVQQLLTNLAGSDFALAFPSRPVICTLHHHKQVWWTTTDPDLLILLEQLAA